MPNACPICGGHFDEPLRSALIRNEYCDFADEIDDGRRSIFHKSGYLETRANAKEAWDWLRSINAILD